MRIISVEGDRTRPTAYGEAVTLGPIIRLGEDSSHFLLVSATATSFRRRPMRSEGNGQDISRLSQPEPDVTEFFGIKCTASASTCFAPGVADGLVDSVRGYVRRI